MIAAYSAEGLGRCDRDHKKVDCLGDRICVSLLASREMAATFRAVGKRT